MVTNFVHNIVTQKPTVALTISKQKDENFLRKTIPLSLRQNYRKFEHTLGAKYTNIIEYYENKPHFNFTIFYTL